VDLSRSAGLKQFKEQNETSVKTRRNNAYKQITAAAASNEAPRILDECRPRRAVRRVDHQTAAVKDWKPAKARAESGVGRECCAPAPRMARPHDAARAGAETKQSCPTCSIHPPARGGRRRAGRMVEHIDKTKATAAQSVREQDALRGDAREEIHDSIMRMSVTNSPVAKILQIGDLSATSRRKRKGRGRRAIELGDVPGM